MKDAHTHARSAPGSRPWSVRLAAWLLLAGLSLVLPGAAQAAAPVLQNNQVLWVSNPATNGARVGLLGLVETNNVTSDLSFRILSGAPYNPFGIEVYSNYFGLLSVANKNILALSDLFSLQVAVTATTNQNLGDTNWVTVIAHLPFSVPELSSNGVSVGRIVNGDLTNSLTFGVDTSATADSRALTAFELLATGEIRVKNGLALDFESQTNYVLSFVATNGLNNANLIFGEALIYLTGLNEPPVFADQAFALPEDVTDTFIGPLKADDPENDPLNFEIVQLVAGGGVIPNDYFEVLNGTNLHLKSALLFPPASNFLTMVVTEIRTDGQPALTNVATVTVEAPKTYSRFGIPLLVPVPGHNGSPADGLPVQAMATGTNQDVYVSGMDANRQPYLQIWAKGFYGDPQPMQALEPGFVPTAMAVAGTNLYLAGHKNGQNTAALYRYSTDGLPLRTNYLAYSSYSYFNIMDMLEDGGKLYVCGGAVAGNNWMVPYWAELDGATLAFTTGSPHWTSRTSGEMGAPSTCYVQWGVATAIAKQPSGAEVYVAGYDTCARSWTICTLDMGWLGCWEHGTAWAYGGVSAFISHYNVNGTVQQTRRSWSDYGVGGPLGTFVKDLAFMSSGGLAYVYALEEFLNPDLPAQSVSTTKPEGSFSQDVVVKQLSTLLEVSSARSFRLYGQGDVKAESLTVVKDGATNSLVVSGVLPRGKATKFNTEQSFQSPALDSYFLLQLRLDRGDMVLDTQWPLVLGQFNYTPTGGLLRPPLGWSWTAWTYVLDPSVIYTPRTRQCLVAPYPSKNGMILAGNLGLGVLSIAQNRNENSVTVPPGRNAGFLTIVKNDGTFEEPVFLEVESDFGISGSHVKPFSGRQMAVPGDTYTVEVLSPIYVRADGTYIGDFDHPVTDQQIKDEAVTRYVCTGYTVADGGVTGNGTSYTFQFLKNTKITFHWTVEHALEIRSDLTGTGAIPAGGSYQRNTTNNLGLTSLAAGNPVPEVKKHWVKKDELVIPSIDGSALDLAEFGTRYVVTGYVATGWAVVSTNVLRPPSQTNVFPAVEPRLQIPQFPMRGPAIITYLWGVQHRVQVSTTSLESQDWPGIKVVDIPSGQGDRTGSGEFWFNRATHLIIGGRETNRLVRALLATGDLAPPRDLSKVVLARSSTNFFQISAGGVLYDYLGAHVDRLLQGTIVSWEYGNALYPRVVAIGNAVDVGEEVQVNSNKSPVIQVVDSPPGSTASDMCEWDDVARRSYPLRPGRFMLHYEGPSDTNIVLTLDVTSTLTNWHYRHLVHPEMPPVYLDPDSNDNLAFLKLAFTTNASVLGSDFSATNRDLSVLLFSRSDSNAVPYQPATGNRLKETLFVRVVATTPWDEQPGGFNVTNPPAPTLAYIGTKVASASDTAGIGTGFIVYTNARYNAAIHDRTKTADAGPIIPVNRQFRTNDLTQDLVVIWYERRDAILWPYTAERFDPQWPLAFEPAALPDPMPDVETMAAAGTNYLRRIVVASRLGSEGKDPALRNQLSFALPRYDQVSIYSQADPNQPGYNPNEEHALLAPSFKFLDQGNPPPVAYALRNDYNRTNHDESYTSDPYVLVQYLDHGTNGGPAEYKMAVYAVELEDDRPQLNPDRYASPVSGQEREFPYVFHYSMQAGEPVQPPYPLGLVIGLTPCNETRGTNVSPQRVYWEDYRGQPWAVSAGDFLSYFRYPLLEQFWVPDPTNTPPGSCLALQTGDKVVLTGSIPNPLFKPNSQFILNGIFVRAFASSPDGFLLAINTTPLLSNKVQAVVLNTGEIQLRARGTNHLVLEDRTNAPLATAGLTLGSHEPTAAVSYTATWPEAVPNLKAGETLTFAGGEYKADYPSADGLPGVIGWAAGEVIFDSLNPLMDNKKAFSDYTARLISPLEERSVELTAADAESLVEKIQPSTGVTRAKGARWLFTGLPASLGKRVSYDPLDRRLALKGFLNDKTLGDSTLTATPPPVYVLEPNILASAESNTLSTLVDLPAWRFAVSNLYALSRNPNQLRRTPQGDADAAAFYAGLEQAMVQVNNQDFQDTNNNPVLIPNAARPQKGLGPGLALVPSPAVLDPDSHFTSGYVTLVENNNADVGGPITLFIVKVSRDYRYRGAIKTILSDNVFDEKTTLRHTGDFGANADDIVYQWFYREEDGTTAPLPPGGVWRMFPDQSDNTIRGLGMYQINLEGTGGLLLADNLFFVRYRHKNDRPVAGLNSTDWAGTEWDVYGRSHTDAGQTTKVGTQWAGAANSPTVDGEYKPQLVMGWIKRVLDRVNPYEARISDFRNETAPANYVSMLQELGQRYEGPVALNPDKNVIENVGLIELYETVLNRGMDLSINLSSPITTPGINTALQLAATRVSDFYMVLGNEADVDAQDPTIAYGDDSMDFATDYGTFASSMFSFENEVPSLLEEELCLLRGVPESYGRPVYNRLFWNFTKSLGEVAYAVNYNITDYNRDGFVDESDAMALYPQGHGDAWGHYLSAVKSQYRLLQHPYYNWVSRAEQYNLFDVVLAVDYLDERRFAEAAAARAKAGAEIVSLTYRSRYVEDPDGQWQGYTDLDTDRAWGVDGWARRAGQGALFDWITANAILPSEDTNLQHNALQKIDRSTVTAIQTLASEIGEIQSQYDNANNGLNPLGLAPDVVPFDIDATFNAVGSTAQIGRPTVQGLGHFSQIYERAVAAVNNARTVFDSASFMQSRLRQVKESADSFRQEIIEQDLDYRNRLIEIFGTPYEGQIGSGKAYPAGYNGPDLMLWMYVDVNDVNNDTVPPARASFAAAFPGFRQQIVQGDSGTGVTDFENTINTYFNTDAAVSTLGAVTNTDLLDIATNNILVLSNLPVMASGYTFGAPAGWGRRASPGELQLTVCDMVQAQADLQLAVGDYFSQVERIQDLVDLLRAKHRVAAESIHFMQANRDMQITYNTWISIAKGTAALLQIAADLTDKTGDAVEKFLPAMYTGMMNGLYQDIPKGAPKITSNALSKLLKTLASLSAAAADITAMWKEIEQLNADINVQKQSFSYEIQEQLKDLEQNLRNERLLRIEALKRLEALRQVSEGYRRTLEGGQRLLDQRQVFNIRVAGVAQRLRYQDMAFRVFRNDAIQRYRAAFDLAARYTYMAAKAFDYETNLSPDDRGSALPLLTDIVRARVLGTVPDGEPALGAGLAGVLATLRDNWSVLCGRMSFNNAQYEQELISLRSELFRIPPDPANDALWRQTLKKYRVDDLWQVPEFRRYCRPPAPRSAGPLPGLVIPFGTEIVLGRNFFGWPLGPGDHAYDPSVFATKIQSAAVYFTNYQTAFLAATPRVYLVPAGLDVMTIPTSLDLETREWTIVDQAIPVPYQTGTNTLADPYWIPAYDSLSEPFGQIRRFSSFLAKDLSEFDPGADSLSYDTRLIGRSVWNTRWLLILPGGHLLADGNEGLDTLIDGAPVPGNPTARDGNGIKDLKLLFNTYGYSGN